jgi:acetoacetate decarboxylase
MWRSDTIKITDHEYILDVYRKELETLRNFIKSKANDQIEISAVEVDFERIDAVSIERYVENNQIYTIVGYKDNKSSSILEWNLFCSYQEHQKLAKEFREYKNTQRVHGIVSVANNTGILSPSPLLSK